MDWLSSALEVLSTSEVWGYAPAAPTASEPAALAALALVAHGQLAAARRPLDWLTSVQAADGSVGPSRQLRRPGWPTSLAALAWQVADREAADESYGAQVEQAVAWLGRERGASAPRSEEMGHDSSLIGWSWAEGTHSWVEPTAWAVLALRTADRRDPARIAEAERLLVDRLLPTGGCNYGNTEVLGQFLRPHLAPTGLCLWALAGSGSGDPRIEASAGYLMGELGPRTPLVSLCYGLLGLAAQGRTAPAHPWLASASARRQPRSLSAHQQALVALAAAANRVTSWTRAGVPL